MTGKARTLETRRVSEAQTNPFSVESAGGIAPPAAHRTRRERLHSTGSCYANLSDYVKHQCTNSLLLDRFLAPSQAAARFLCPRNRLNFLMAQRIKALSR